MARTPQAPPQISEAAQCALTLELEIDQHFRENPHDDAELQLLHEQVEVIQPQLEDPVELLAVKTLAKDLWCGRLLTQITEVNDGLDRVQGEINKSYTSAKRRQELHIERQQLRDWTNQKARKQYDACLSDRAAIQAEIHTPGSGIDPYKIYEIVRAARGGAYHAPRKTFVTPASTLVSAA